MDAQIRRVLKRCRTCGMLVTMSIVPAICGCRSAPVRPEAQAVPSYASVQQELERLIPKLMRKNDVVGLSIALIDDQETVWAAGYGYADASAGIPATVQTVYRVASISKLLTSTAVMQLAEAGLIDIDRPIADYLTDFTIKTRFADADPITPRNLMTHHSRTPDIASRIYASTSSSKRRVSWLPG